MENTPCKNLEFNSVDDVLNSFKSVADLCRYLEVSEAAGRMWRWRKSIPGHYWQDIVDFAAEVGVALTLNDVANAHGRGKDRKRAA